MGPVAKFFECALSAFLTLPFSSPCHRMKKSVGKQHFRCCPSSLGNISYIPQWEWWDGWKLLEVITIPSEMQVALSLLSNISAWCYVTKRPGGCCSNPHIFMDRRVFLQGAFYLFPHKLLLFVWVRSTGVQCSETIMVWEACSMDYAVSITVTPTVFLLSSGQCTNHSCMHRH